MTNDLHFDIADQRINYTGLQEREDFNTDRIIEFNHRHGSVLRNYDIELVRGHQILLDEHTNNRSNLGSLRNRQLRESAILAAALSSAAVGLTGGRGAIRNYAEDDQTKEVKERLKRANDRTAAQIMSEVLQTTTETFPVGEEVLIESTITEGVRMKPGKEAGGNPTISVGALFGKKHHRARYGMPMTPNVTLLSMGNDVVEGTTKSIMGHHSSLTTLFLTESNVKRHLPDIYVQRWMAGVDFAEFNPRETNLVDAAHHIADAYGTGNLNDLCAFFLERPRHDPAVAALNKAGVATPYDIDGDMFPAIILGHEGLDFPNGRRLNSFIGEIGGSAEWAVGVLPLVWRGGQALGMLTSHTALTKANMTSEQKWKERFHFTEEEFIMIQDARFEHKPYFKIGDILEDPYAGGISAFGAITDNFYLPFMKGVTADPENNSFTVNVLTVNSLGRMDCWCLTFAACTSLEKSKQLIASPKDNLEKLTGGDLRQAITDIVENDQERKRYKIAFRNEYYPALIPMNDRMVLLEHAIEALIEREALTAHDREIVEITKELADHWFVPHSY